MNFRQNDFGTYLHYDAAEVKILVADQFDMNNMPFKMEMQFYTCMN